MMMKATILIVSLLVYFSIVFFSADASDQQQLFTSSSALAGIKDGNVLATSSSSTTRQVQTRSDIECAVLCGAVSGSAPSSIVTWCNSFAYSDVAKSCLMSPDSGADFSAAAAAGGFGVVFRRPVNQSWYREFSVQLGSRSFRVIQQRVKGALSFNRLWAEYEEGFGDEFDFWLGLRSINALTGKAPKTLRVEARTWSGVLYVSEYSGFTVGDSSTYYTMTYTSYLTGGTTNASTDALNYHVGAKFSTRDRDNSGCTCSANNGGSGWWFKCCSYSNPNGLYYSSAVSGGEATMYWYGTGSQRVSLQSIRLMLQV